MFPSSSAGRLQRLRIIGFMFFSLLTVWLVHAPSVHAASLVQTGKQVINVVTYRIPISFPQFATAGDLLIAVVSVNSTSTISTRDAGWSTAINQRGNPTQVIFYKVAVGGERSFLPTFSPIPTNGGGEQIYEYAGGEKYLDQVGSETGNGADLSSGTISTTGSNELLLAAFITNAQGSFDDASWNDAGEGFTERNDFFSANHGTYGGGDNFVNVTGTQNVTVSSTVSATWLGQIVSFTSTPPGGLSASSHMEKSPKQVDVSRHERRKPAHGLLKMLEGLWPFHRPQTKNAGS